MRVSSIQGQHLMRIQSVGRALRRAPVQASMENQLGVPFMSINDYERLVAIHDKLKVKRDQNGNAIPDYTLN